MSCMFTYSFLKPVMSPHLQIESNPTTKSQTGADQHNLLLCHIKVGTSLKWDSPFEDQSSEDQPGACAYCTVGNWTVNVRLVQLIVKTCSSSRMNSYPLFIRSQSSSKSTDPRPASYCHSISADVDLQKLSMVGKSLSMAPFLLSSNTAPEGMWDALQDAHPPLSSPSLGCCVLVTEQQSDGSDHTNLGFGQQITLKHTRWLTRIKPPWRLSLMCCWKTSSLLSIQRSTWRLYIVLETSGLGSSVKAFICS